MEPLSTILTGLRIARFKMFNDAVIELGQRVVFIGPNNAGKTSALQALALWHMGVKRWLEKRGGGLTPEKRPGVTLNRRGLISLPVPAANLLWHDLRVREGTRDGGKTRTRNINIEIEVEGVTAGAAWRCGFEFDYANEESFYCRPLKTSDGTHMEVPSHLAELRLSYLPPMSGLAANEFRHDEGTINVLVGEGRTAETLRNSCWQVLNKPGGGELWDGITDSIESLYGARIDKPEYIAERGEITMHYHDRGKIRLDLSSSGRGMQQTLLLLSHLASNAGSVLLLDEPDAHLEVLRQRQIYQVISDATEKTGGQIIAASHSEVILNEAAGRDTVIAFVGKPHRIDGRASQVMKSLKDFGFDQYYQAETAGWVLYLEGATDLAILHGFAVNLGHPALSALERPFVYYVANQPRKAQAHFYALREAKSDLRGFALYDRLDQQVPQDPNLVQYTWSRREIESYICSRDTLLAYAWNLGRNQAGDLFAAVWKDEMESAIAEIEKALASLGRGSPWGPDMKVSDDFLPPVFKKFFGSLKLPDLMNKTDYHTLVRHVPAGWTDPEVGRILDQIWKVSQGGSE